MFAGVIFVAGCTRLAQFWYLSQYDHDIWTFGAALQSAKNDVQRAAAYSSRGDAYSEKARYSRTMKLIAGEEYNRLFDLAIQDHHQAIALDSRNAEMYYHRGLAYAAHAALDSCSSLPVISDFLFLASILDRCAWSGNAPEFPAQLRIAAAKNVLEA